MSLRKAVRISVVVAVWLPTLVLVSGLARGQATFGGYSLGASASGATWVYDNPGLGIPARPAGELHAAFAETDLDSGPSSYGLASLLWPGQVAANVPGFIQQTFEAESGEEFGFEVPNYPVRAESAFPQGPEESGSEFGGARMSSSAHRQLSNATAHLNSTGFPGVGSIGSVTAFAADSVEGEVAVSEARSTANDISLFGGLIEIDQVVTRAEATSDGVEGKVGGRTVVTGARIQGNEVSIDNNGVHAGGDSQDPGSSIPTQEVLQALAANGITLSLTDPIDTIEGPVARRSLGGLIVQFEPSALQPLYDALPPELRSQFPSQLDLDQRMSVSFASAVVVAGASQPISFDPPSLPPVVGGETSARGGDVTTIGSQTTTTQPGLLPQASAGDSQVGAGEVGDVGLAAAPVPFEGIPIPAMFGLLLAAMLATVPLVRVADRILGGRAGVCPTGRD